MCKICGGDTRLSFGKTHGVCSACGSATTFPKINDVEKVDLFNEGNWLRIQREDFDMAAYVFEKLIRQDAKDAEAHWCYVLCRYGIKYAEDPKSGQRLPVSRRVDAGVDLLHRDVNFREAIKHSDWHTANVYVAEAKRIIDIHRTISNVHKAAHLILEPDGTPVTSWKPVIGGYSRIKAVAKTEGAKVDADAKSDGSVRAKVGAGSGAKIAPYIAAGASVEELIENGKECLKLRNYDTANKVFGRAVKEYPDDHRGWWGMIVSATAAFTKETRDWASLNSWYGHVKRLADARVFAALEKEYMAYAKKTAENDAAKDIEAIGDIVQREKERVRQFHERQKMIQYEKIDREKAFEKLTPEYDDMARRAAASGERYANRLKWYDRLNKIAILFLITGFLLGLFVDGIILGVEFAIFLIIVVANNLSMSKMARELGGGKPYAVETVRSAVSGLKRISDKTGNERAAEEKRYQEHMARLDRETKFLDSEIARVEGKIAPCEKYLALGKGRISSMFFAWRCNSFGVKQEVEDGATTAKLRKAAWDVKR